MQEAILSVRELTEQLRKTLEGRFPFVWVRGEVTNLTRPNSGHVYFTLKDADAQLQCVWFRHMQRQTSQGFDPLTGEVFDSPRPSPLELLRNGLDVLCAGRITLYAPRGQYQLAVELMQPAGEGLLAQAFEASKRKLAALGYFNRERKRPLPHDPQRVALITSPTGAAIHDFMELASSRGSGARIRLFPALVQGAEAAPAIVRALQQANEQGWAQVIVLVRGGGSLEDLWAFNEEAVAEAVFESRLPVLAGIGHEVDVTLADMTADVRAATPSHAAQLLWPARAELFQLVDEAEAALVRAARRQLETAGQRLAQYESALRWFSPMRHQARLAEQLDGLHHRLQRAALQWVESVEARRDRLARALRTALSPARLDLLTSRVDALAANMASAMPRLLTAQQQRLDAAHQRLQTAEQEMLARSGRELDKLEFALSAANPLAPLKRGYALVRGADGGLLRSVAAAPVGSAISVRLADGSLAAVVSQVQPDAERPAASEAAQVAQKQGRKS
ncbi:exodeoxyribonuclease VII large subunit [Desulfovibrio desulfuricans]|uniref:exodeoxyribonuclease VII large subunit n=1 Tax=Desulfovibrio desulfuricans TaxID=876 RepID=UPI0035B05561